jgi:hypothetical protein
VEYQHTPVDYDCDGSRIMTRRYKGKGKKAPAHSSNESKRDDGGFNQPKRVNNEKLTFKATCISQTPLTTSTEGNETGSVVVLRHELVGKSNSTQLSKDVDQWLQ